MYLATRRAGLPGRDRRQRGRARASLRLARSRRARPPRRLRHRERPARRRRDRRRAGSRCRCSRRRPTPGPASAARRRARCSGCCCPSGTRLHDRSADTDLTWPSRRLMRRPNRSCIWRASSPRQERRPAGRRTSSRRTAAPAGPRTRRRRTRRAAPPIRGCGGCRRPARRPRSSSSAPAISGTRADSTCGRRPLASGHLVQVAEQPEAGDVGHRARAGGERRRGGAVVEGGHHLDARARSPRAQRGLAWPPWSRPRRRSAWSGRARRPRDAVELRTTRSGCTTPVTAMPYFGSGSSIEWPPTIATPAAPATSAPPRRISARVAAPRRSSEKATRFSAESPGGRPSRTRPRARWPPRRARSRTGRRRSG